MTTQPLPATAVIRVATGTFPRERYEEFLETTARSAEYLVPAIKDLPGLISWQTGVTPEGSVAMVSLWDTEEHAQQMDTLEEMVVHARGEAKKAGQDSASIINHPVVWTI